ncbi:MAG: hypothetical protein WC869_11925 [Phycisphaerae bacterium]
MQPEAQYFPVHRQPYGGFTFLHPYCNLCRRQRQSEFSGHPLVSPHLQRYVTGLCRGARSGASSRGLVWGLVEDDVLRLYVQQGGRCAVTGIQMSARNSRQAAGSFAVAMPKDRDAASIDRVDSAGNYTLDNVQLVCRVVNTMKLDMSLNEFRQWCDRVVAHTDKIERDLLEAVA